MCLLVNARFVMVLFLIHMLTHLIMQSRQSSKSGKTKKKDLKPCKNQTCVDTLLRPSKKI